MSASHSFVHLGARSEYSIGESFAAVEDLCRAAARDGQEVLALTDVLTLAAAPRFQRAARHAGLRPIFGLELRVTADGEDTPGKCAYPVRVLADSAHGWRSLVRLSNIGRVRTRTVPAFSRFVPQVPASALIEESRGLILLIGGRRGELTRHLLAKDFERAELHVGTWRQAWSDDRIYFEIPDPIDEEGMSAARVLDLAATHFGLRTVAVPQVSAAELSDEMAWRFFGRDPVVRQSAERDPRIAGQLPERLGDLIVPPEERAHLLERELAVRRFAEFPAAIASTLEIAERCGTVSIPEAERRFPVLNFTRGVDAESFIWNAAFERAGARYGDLPGAIKDRLNHEYRHLLDSGMANALVSLSRLHEEFETRGILCGPGSGVLTGSLIASLLGITRLDPVAFGLRFQLPENIATKFPPLEFSVPASQEREAIRALTELFSGQIAMPGRWQRWRFGGALEIIGTTSGLTARERGLLVQERALTEARERESRSPAVHLPDPNTKLVGAEGAAWLARRLEGKPRTLAGVPGRFTFSVEPILASLPVREELDRDGTAQRVCEWNEDEVTSLRYGCAVARNAALLDLVGDATASARVSEGGAFSPARFGPDDEDTASLLQAGATAGISPLESPLVRRVLRAAAPPDLVSFVRACESSHAAAAELDLPTVLLSHTAVALKAHCPVSFYAAALTQAGVDPRRLAALLEEVRARRIPVQPLDVNCSDWNWTAEGRAIRPGFCIVRDLPQPAAREIIRLRRELAFDDLADVMRRTDPQRVKDAHLLLLLRAGAFDGFGMSREQLQSLTERLMPLLRPRRSARSEDNNPLEFFGQDASWWLQNHEAETEAARVETTEPLPREGERDATCGVWISPPPPSAEETKFLERACAKRYLGHRDDGRRVCLVGRVDAHEADPSDPEVLLLEFAGCTVQLRGPLAKRASSSALGGKPCLVVGIARVANGVGQVEGESFVTVEAAMARADRARSLQLDAFGRVPEIQHALYTVLKTFSGATSVRLLSKPVKAPRALARLESRRVTLCPMLEVELNSLLGPDHWRVEEPEPANGESLREVAPGAASLVRRVFESFVGR